MYYKAVSDLHERLSMLVRRTTSIKYDVLSALTEELLVLDDW